MKKLFVFGLIVSMAGVSCADSTGKGYIFAIGMIISGIVMLIPASIKFSKDFDEKGHS